MVLAISPTYSQEFPLFEGFDLFERATILYIEFGRWLKQQEESLSKKAFRELLKGYGMLRREATKFIKAAKATASYEASDLAKLGTMVFSLVAPKYEALWEEMYSYGELTQDFVDALKKERFPTKKREKNEPVSVWKQPPGGGMRYCQIPPIHDQETGVKLERIVLESGVTPQKVVTLALECYQALKEGKLRWVEDVEQAIAPGTVGVADTDLASGTDLAGGTVGAGGTNGAYAVETESVIVVEETKPAQLSVPKPTSSKETAQTELDELIIEQALLFAPQTVALPSASRVSGLKISFGKTLDYLPHKSVTRRVWKDSHAAKFIRAYENNQLVEALDKDARKGGKRIGYLELVCEPYKEKLSDMPDSDLQAEGGMVATTQEFINQFFDGNADNEVWVVRFKFYPDVESQESVVQSEAQLAQAVEPEEQSKSTDMLETTGTVSADSETSCALKTDSEQHNAPTLLFPTPRGEYGECGERGECGESNQSPSPHTDHTDHTDHTSPAPTERWREGWKKGSVVVTNSTIPTLPRWVKGELLQIIDVSGPVGSIQRITVINSNFQQYSTYGNWIEEAPLCQVSGGDREWSGKVVKIDSIGRTYHRVSAVDDASCWTSIKHEFLVPIDTTSATAVVDNHATVNNSGDSESNVEQIVLEEWGLSLGDVVQWADIERSLMMAGQIYDVTADYALVDCGFTEPVPIAYPQLSKITPELIEKAFTDHASPISQIFYRAKSYVAMWNVNALGAQSSLKELLAMCWHYKVWIDTLAMESENVLMFIPGGRDYLTVNS